MAGPNADDMAKAAGGAKFHQAQMMVVDSGTESDDDELEMLDSSECLLKSIIKITSRGQNSAANDLY